MPDRVRAICLLALASGAAAACVGTAPLAFYDMHDGDMKQITAQAYDFQITPYNNTESWVVHGTFDANCRASVNFNVPGKPNPPPVNLTATLWTLGSTDGSLSKLGFEFTDPSGTLAPTTQPLNFWVQDKSPEPEGPITAIQEFSASAKGSLCLSTQKLVVDDMHDGDMKSLKVQGDELQIAPYNNKQIWSVQAKFDQECVAPVDFNVPHKPSPPPVVLDAKVWRLESIAGLQKDALLFTDPSGTIASAHTPLNAWIPNNA